jgi:hypothetical protein
MNVIRETTQPARYDEAVNGIRTTVTAAVLPGGVPLDFQARIAL